MWATPTAEAQLPQQCRRSALNWSDQIQAVLPVYFQPASVCVCVQASASASACASIQVECMCCSLRSGQVHLYFLLNLVPALSVCILPSFFPSLVCLSFSLFFILSLSFSHCTSIQPHYVIILGHLKVRPETKRNCTAKSNQSQFKSVFLRHFILKCDGTPAVC